MHLLCLRYLVHPFAWCCQRTRCLCCFVLPQ
nr:MAG TPA: hypothetical protein [Caudoviricetes sp.]